MRIGYGYTGSPRLESTNTENFEVLPLVSPSSKARIQFYKFQFRNDQDCTVSINHGVISITIPLHRVNAISKKNVFLRTNTKMIS